MILLIPTFLLPDAPRRLTATASKQTGTLLYRLREA